jgi:hypothetical protein
MVPDAEAYRRREIGSKRMEEEAKKIQPLRPLSAADSPVQPGYASVEQMRQELMAKGGTIKRFENGGSNSISMDDLNEALRDRAPTIPEQFNRYIAPHIQRGLDAMLPFRQLAQKTFERNVYNPMNESVINNIGAAIKTAGTAASDADDARTHMMNAARKAIGLTPQPIPFDASKALGDINPGEFDRQYVDMDKNFARMLEAYKNRQAQGKAKGGSVMGINVASDKKAGMHYADLIVDGHKTLESRNTDSLRPYVGKRVAIVRTGSGKAKAIGEVTIGEPIVANKQKFHNMREHHMVPEGSTFDIKTPTKHMYPLSEPVRYDEERDVGHGIVSRKVVHKDKGGKIEVRPTVFDDKASRRNPKIEAAARALMEGEMTKKAYEKVVAKEKPVKRYDFIPAPATDEQAMDVLIDRQKQNWRSHENWPEGHRVGLRLDIPAYERHGVWVNSIHDESGGEDKFPTSYGPVSSVRNATFEGSPNKAIRVATGEQNKTPFARIKGELEHIDEKKAIAHMKKFLHHPDYRQIGYDPRRHGDFYDRETMEPVTHSEHVVQIGPLVLAKKPKYGKREVYAKGGATHAHHLDIEERPL